MGSTPRLPPALLLLTMLVPCGCTRRDSSPSFSIAGTVTGTDRASIDLTGATGTTTIITGAGGAYAFTGLAPGDYTLTPSKPGYTFAPVTRSVTVGDADVVDQHFHGSIPVEVTYAISGVAGGLPGAHLSLTGPVDRSTWTGAGGQYAFPRLPGGTYQVTPTLPGAVYRPWSRTVVVADGDVVGVDFTEGPLVAGTHAIRGVTWGTYFNVPVILGGAAQATTALDEGHFAFGFLTDGAYTVTPVHQQTVFVPHRRSAEVAGADVVLEPFLGLQMYGWDNFTAGILRPGQWKGEERRVELVQQAALLTSWLRVSPGPRSHPVTLALRPETRPGRITSARAVVALDSCAVDGTGEAVAALDVRFQAPADRVAGPGDLTRALFLRAALVDRRLGGPVAVWQAIECGDPTCATSVPIGTPVAGATWPAEGATIERGTGYALSVSFDPATRVVTFGLSGGAFAEPLSGSLDLSATSTPFAADLSPANFHQVELSAISSAGQAFGSASVAARFDDVAIGTDGSPPVLFDDFGTGTAFDPTRWRSGGAVVQVTGSPAALRVGLEQMDAPAVVAVELDPLPTVDLVAVQAEVAVVRWNHAGAGQVGARVAAALYNDGSGGLGTGADVPGPGSQVGDVMALLNVTDAEVSAAVVRCNVADCSAAPSPGVTFLMPWTALGAVALGEPHWLRISWDQPRHTVGFQLDARLPATFDPVGAGAPLVSRPARPTWQMGAGAVPAGPGAEFGPGSTGAVEAVFTIVEVAYGPIPQLDQLP